jgi:hypothetical protein
LAKESKPFPDGAFVTECFQHIMQDIFPENETVLVFHVCSVQK